MKPFPVIILLALWAGLMAAPAGAQIDRPVQPLEPARAYQDAEDGEDEETPRLQVSPENLRPVRPITPVPQRIETEPGEEPPPTLPAIQLPTLRTLTVAPAWHMARATVSGARNEQRAVPDSQRFLEPVAALSSFHFRFQNGDHKIRRIAVLDEDRFAQFSFADQDSNDPFEAGARWLVISQGHQHEVSGRGGGSFRLPLEPGPDNHTAVLTGFDVQRAGGTDANVRTFGVWLEQTDEGPAVRVTLFDDMGPDFRGLEETTLAAFGAAFIPFAAPVGSTAMAVDGLSRFSAQGGYRPFAVTIQYAWIPDSLIVREGAAAGGNDRVFTTRGAIALQGFFFHFDNEDHHLLEVGIVPGPSRGIRYRDNNWDDPVRWEVQYIELNDEMRD